MAIVTLGIHTHTFLVLMSRAEWKKHRGFDGWILFDKVLPNSKSCLLWPFERPYNVIKLQLSLKFWGTLIIFQSYKMAYQLALERYKDFVCLFNVVEYIENTT